jgi:hypothetical protein
MEMRRADTGTAAPRDYIAAFEPSLIGLKKEIDCIRLPSFLLRANERLYAIGKSFEVCVYRRAAVCQSEIDDLSIPVWSRPHTPNVSVFNGDDRYTGNATSREVNTGMETKRPIFAERRGKSNRRLHGRFELRRVCRLEGDPSENNGNDDEETVRSMCHRSTG